MKQAFSFCMDMVSSVVATAKKIVKKTKDGWENAEQNNESLELKLYNNSSSDSNSFFGAEYSVVFNQSKKMELGSYGILNLNTIETNSKILQKRGDASRPVSVFYKTSYNNFDSVSSSAGIKINHYNESLIFYLGPSKFGIAISRNNSCEFLNIVEPTHEMMLGLSLDNSTIFGSVSSTYQITDTLSYTKGYEASMDYIYLAAAYAMGSSGTINNSFPSSMPTTPTI